MKFIKFICLLLSILITNSCTNNEMDKEDNNLVNMPCYQYNILLISFQDTTGKDLVKGIGYDWWQSDIIQEEEAVQGPIKRDLYTLDVVFPDSCMSMYALQKELEKQPGIRPVESVPVLVLRKVNGYYYLYFSEASYAGRRINGVYEYPMAEMITFKLRCPYIFGDDTEHEIISYWKPRPSPYSPYCYHIEFDGKEIINHQDFSEMSENIIISSYFTVLI